MGELEGERGSMEPGIIPERLSLSTTVSGTEWSGFPTLFVILWSHGQGLALGPG